MKQIILSIFIFTSFIALAQKSQIKGQLIKPDSSVPYHHFTVSLKHAGSIIRETVPDAEGKFTLHNVERGFYSLVVTRPFHNDYIADSLLVVTDKTVFLNIYPCFSAKGQIPKCIGDHTDHIIPIVYGKPTAQTIKNAKKGLVHIGGCLVTGCDPNYYCTLHKIEL